MDKVQKTETTEAGEQMLTHGVPPVNLAERLSFMAARPSQPKCNPHAQQKPCDLGLFDEVQRNQIDLIDVLNSTPTPPNDQPK